MLSHTSWGSHRNSILNIYKATILSKIDYGSQCYITAPTSYIKKLDAIHNSGLRMALGAFHTSPVNSIYCEAECPSLCFRRETLLHKYANSLKFKPHLSQYKYFFSQTVTTQEIISTISSTIPNKYNIDPPWSIAQANIDLSLSRIPKKQQTVLQIKQTFLDIKHTKYPNHKFIYTDGSKTSNNTGAAYVGDNVEATYKIAQQAGILTAELIAITKALDYIRNNPHTNWVIATDSLNSIKTIQAYQPKHPLGIEIQNKTNQLTNQNKFITYLWIPSHSQIIGNEKADKMAKAAHNSLTTLNYSFWKEDMNAITKAAFNNLSQLNWDLLDDSKLSEIKEDFKEFVDAENLMPLTTSDFRNPVCLEMKVMGGNRANQEGPNAMTGGQYAPAAGGMAMDGLMMGFPEVDVDGNQTNGGGNAVSSDLHSMDSSDTFASCTTNPFNSQGDLTGVETGAATAAPAPQSGTAVKKSASGDTALRSLGTSPMDEGFREFGALDRGSRVSLNDSPVTKHRKTRFQGRPRTRFGDSLENNSQESLERRKRLPSFPQED
nr:unnamed protein product [Callosobruchus chinensis]